MINWTATPEDRALIEKIADRYIAMMAALKLRLEGEDPRTDIIMDLACVHLNIQPLRLADLLAADDFNLGHDVGGIRGHLVRNDPPRLGECFLPRFSA